MVREPDTAASRTASAPRQRWGTSRSSGDLIDSQLAREAELLRQKQEAMREGWLDFMQGDPLPTATLAETPEPRQAGGQVPDSPPRVLEAQSIDVSREPMPSYMTVGYCHKANTTVGGQASALGRSLGIPALPLPLPAPPAPMPRVQGRSVPARLPMPRLSRGLHEPAKALGADGRVRLQGVRSTSDLKLYMKDVDPYSREAWEIREAYKKMRASQHAVAASSCWDALHDWRRSEKTLDEWHSSVKRR